LRILDSGPDFRSAGMRARPDSMSEAQSLVWFDKQKIKKISFLFQNKRLSSYRGRYRLRSDPRISVSQRSDVTKSMAYDMLQKQFLIGRRLCGTQTDSEGCSEKRQMAPHGTSFEAAPAVKALPKRNILVVQTAPRVRVSLSGASDRRASIRSALGSGGRLSGSRERMRVQRETKGRLSP
jgi:hypothetical protein